jgi:hypothetical protein
MGLKRRGGMLMRVTCPHCWEHFSPEQVLWVSEHQDLLGDPRLGPEQPQRFLPTRFNVAGEALDARGFACRQLACPHCHLVVPRPFLEMEPLFLSIFGAMGSGKSYLLASMIWELRKCLPLEFAISFADADPSMNRVLNDYEEALFANTQAQELIPLKNLIRKTEEQGDLYDVVAFGTQNVSYPRPFVFALQPQAGHPHLAKAETLGRVVCLYDNAGESFEPGKDVVSNPVTRHMAQSRCLFFVFDPTQDARFRKHCDERLGRASAPRVSRQEPILQEAATRIRRSVGLKQTEKHTRPLIVIVTKCDAWLQLIQDPMSHDPWKEVSFGQMGGTRIEKSLSALDTAAVERWSQLVRALLLEHCPEIVTGAEAFAEHVTYIPVSAVGWNTQVDESTGLLSLRPEETQPYWVTVPVLYALCHTVPGLIPSIVRKKVASPPADFTKWESM